MAACFLRVGNDPLEQAQRFSSMAAALRRYEAIARDLDRFGQAIEASIHFTNSLAEIVEYPEYVLSLGPNGGLRVERT